MAPIALRRQSTFNENGGSSGESSRRPSLADFSRKSSVGGLSLFLSRSKKSNSTHGLEPDSDVAAQRLGDGFSSLPDEITTQIICYLGRDEYFALRLTSRAILNLLRSNSAPIARSILAHAAPTEEDSVYSQQLYPQPKPCINENWMLQMLRRQAQVEKMVAIIASYTQIKVYMLPTYPRFEDFGPHKRKLIRRFHSPAWTLYHFLENYRQMVVFLHPLHTDHSQAKTSECPSCIRCVKELLQCYPAPELVSAYHFYDLVLQHLRQLSRAPSHVGTIERKLRGWTRTAPSDSQLAQVIIFGGIPLLSKVSILKGKYNERVELLGTFVDKLGWSSTVQRRMVVSTTSSNRLKLSLAEVSAFEALQASLDPPFSDISGQTLSALPSLDRFITGDWVAKIYDIIDADAQITDTFGFVQNVLAGKCDGADYLDPVKDFT